MRLSEASSSGHSSKLARTALTSVSSDVAWDDAGLRIPPAWVFFPLDLKDVLLRRRRSTLVAASRSKLAEGLETLRRFQKHYLGREVCADTWGILQGQKPQQALIRQACTVGHSISKRRPTDLTAEQAASVNTHPLIKRLERDLRGLRQGLKKYEEARRKLRDEKQNLTAEQAVDDIERQVQGVGFAKQAAVDTSSRPQRPAQKRLTEALTAPLGDTLEDQFRRRDNAINAVSAYCVVEEGPTVRRTNTSSAYPSGRAAIGEPPAESSLHVALMSVFVENQERPRRCFICVGKALTLAGDDGAVQDLIHEFYTPSDWSKHFHRKHLSNLRDGDKIQCQACDMSLDHKQHLQNHAMRVHGTVS